MYGRAASCCLNYNASYPMPGTKGHKSDIIHDTTTEDRPPQPYKYRTKTDVHTRQIKQKKGSNVEIYARRSTLESNTSDNVKTYIQLPSEER